MIYTNLIRPSVQLKYSNNTDFSVNDGITPQNVMRTPAANEKQPYRRKHTQSGIAEQAG